MAWDKVNRKWRDIESILIAKNNMPCAIDSKEGIWQIQNGQIELMQYTGREDKNNKEIYNGHIVKRSDGTIGYVWYCDVDARYEFQVLTSGTVMEKWTSMDFPLIDDVFSGTDYEIIGHVCENQELLK